MIVLFHHIASFPTPFLSRTKQSGTAPSDKSRTSSQTVRMQNVRSHCTVTGRLTLVSIVSRHQGLSFWDSARGGRPSGLAATDRDALPLQCSPPALVPLADLFDPSTCLTCRPWLGLPNRAISHMGAHT